MAKLSLICVFGALVIGSLAQHEHEHEHEHEQHGHAFHDVTEFFGAQNEQLSYEQTTQLIWHMLYRVGCNDGIQCLDVSKSCFIFMEIVKLISLVSCQDFVRRFFFFPRPSIPEVPP